MSLRLLTAAILAGLLAFPLPGRAAEPATRPAVEPDGLKATFQPTKIDTVTSVSFSQHGQPQETTRTASVLSLLRLEPHGTLVPLLVRDIRYTHITVEEGKDLEFRSSGPGIVVHDWVWSRDVLQTAISVKFGLPESELRKIARIDGTLEVVYALGDRRQTVIASLADALDKRVALKDSQDWVRITRPRAGEVAVEYNQPDQEARYGTAAIYNLDFFTPEGKPIPIAAWNDLAHAGNVMERVCYCKIPDNARVVIETYPPKSLYRKLVTFTLTNLPLTQAKEPIPPVEGVVTDIAGPHSPKPIEAHPVP